MLVSGASNRHASDGGDASFAVSSADACSLTSEGSALCSWGTRSSKWYLGWRENTQRLEEYLRLGKQLSAP